jgi:hypothetical protein
VRAPVAPGISWTLRHRLSRMLSLRPQVRRDYPLSFSISITRGKELTRIPLVTVSVAMSRSHKLITLA